MGRDYNKVQGDEMGRDLNKVQDDIMGRDYNKVQGDEMERDYNKVQVMKWGVVAWTEERARCSGYVPVTLKDRLLAVWI